MQVNVELKQKKRLIKENNCALAVILLKRADIDGIRCIFAGISAKEKHGGISEANVALDRASSWLSGTDQGDVALDRTSSRLRGTD